MPVGITVPGGVSGVLPAVSPGVAVAACTVVCDGAVVVTAETSPGVAVGSTSGARAGKMRETPPENQQTEEPITDTARPAIASIM